MIGFKFEVTKTIDNIPVRHYQDRDAWDETDIDSGYLMGCKICDAVDALLKALEDEDQMKKELLRTVRDHIGGRCLN